MRRVRWMEEWSTQRKCLIFLFRTFDVSQYRINLVSLLKHLSVFPIELKIYKLVTFYRCHQFDVCGGGVLVPPSPNQNNNTPSVIKIIGKVMKVVEKCPTGLKHVNKIINILSQNEGTYTCFLLKNEVPLSFFLKKSPATFIRGVTIFYRSFFFNRKVKSWKGPYRWVRK